MSGNNVDLGRDFIIPNGMSQKEMLAYKLTGKLPKSVEERLVDTKNSDYTSGEDDQILKINSAGYIYDEPHDIDTGDTDNAESDIGILFKLVEHIFG